MPCYTSEDDDGYHEFISLLNLKTATFPPGRFWPVSFSVPKLETVRFTTPHARRDRQRNHTDPRLISNVLETNRNRAKFLCRTLGNRLLLERRSDAVRMVATPHAQLEAGSLSMSAYEQRPLFRPIVRTEERS